MHMKSKFYPLLLIPVLFLASCTKWLPGVQQNISGSWKIVSAERQTAYGNEQISTGYEYGTFYFSNNGNAQYSDQFGQLNGTWQLVPHPQDGTTALQLRLYGLHNSDTIEWEFYSIDASGNRLVGYMNQYGDEYRYEFRRQ